MDCLECGKEAEKPWHPECWDAAKARVLAKNLCSECGCPLSRGPSVHDTECHCNLTVAQLQEQRDREDEKLRMDKAVIGLKIMLCTKGDE